MVLSAKTGQLKTLRRTFAEQDVHSIDFCDGMLDGSTEEQLARVAATPEEDIIPLCVAAFGPVDTIDAHTRRLSLWR
ncbi:DUF2000 family protein [Nocardia iowensis]|uniref:DUF2000 family protein n=1 Tax=Nocardia iowensis TaxID=204891 RepID=UPI0031BB5468